MLGSIPLSSGATRTWVFQGWCIACAKEPSRSLTGLAVNLQMTAACSSCANQIIRFYLNEDPILPTMPTFWLGDLDQREMVLERLDEFHIRPIFGDGLSGSTDNLHTRDMSEIRKMGSRFVAQPIGLESQTTCFSNGCQTQCQQEHVIFALRRGESFEVFPGALTRVALEGRNDFEAGWTSRDTWVLGDDSESHLLQTRSISSKEPAHPDRQVTSRVAEAFYWMGRYLERAYHQAYLIQVVETLETEELNSAERKLYRPMWNRLLPPIEKSAGNSRRSITNRLDRYRLLLLPEPGSVVSTFERAFSNAD